MSNDSGPRARLGRISAVLALTGAILAMHGMSSHAPSLHGAEPATAAMQSVDRHEANHGDGHDAHDDSCPSCSDGNVASSCAFIVAANPGWRPRPCQALPLHLNQTPDPAVRAWSPDPPVPKVAFVMT